MAFDFFHCLVRRLCIWLLHFCMDESFHIHLHDVHVQYVVTSLSDATNCSDRLWRMCGRLLCVIHSAIQPGTRLRAMSIGHIFNCH